MLFTGTLAATLVRKAALSELRDLPARCRRTCPRRFHGIGTPLQRAKRPKVSRGAFDRFADCGCMSGLALIELLNGLLNVADALLHLSGNLL